MRTFALLALVAAACSGDDTASVDAITGNRPAPVVIPGGGIGSGAIDGVANLYVIDDASRLPIEGATVRVGTLEGTTDADGLFVAEGLVGPQTVVATAASYRSEVWLGANGANMTMNMQKAAPTVPQATLSGSITDFADGLSVDAGHFKVATVGYSHDDTLGNAVNDLKTPDNGNSCFVADGEPCNFTVVTRTGALSLIALIFDYDTNNTGGTTADDTLTLLGYASRTGITVSAGVDQTGQDLTLIPMGSTVVQTVDWGTPPAGLTPALGLIGIELGDGSGVLQLPVVTAAMPAARVPALSHFSGAQYRLTAIAQNAAMPPTQSFVVRRHLTSATLSAGTWTDPPTDVSLTRTRASWTNSPTGTLHSAEYWQDTTALLNITSFDGSSAADIPDLITLPGGTITGRAQALTAIGVDLGDIAIDRDRDKITGAAATPSQVP